MRSFIFTFIVQSLSIPTIIVLYYAVFGFFNVASNFFKRKCVYKFNKILIVFPY